jgi:hypothetical protein
VPVAAEKLKMLNLKSYSMKRSNLKTFFMVVATVSLFAYLNSCSQSNDSHPTGKITVSMTDSIANYLAVNVDVQAIRVNVTSADSLADDDSVSLDSSQWFELETHAGVYNLLDFSNGVDTLLAQGELPVGYVSQIRLILGENNSIVTLTDTFALNIPSGSTSGFKILVNQELTDVGSLDLLFDFDAGKSVIVKGNGAFQLKPVLNLVEPENL